MTNHLTSKAYHINGQRQDVVHVLESDQVLERDYKYQAWVSSGMGKQLLSANLDISSWKELAFVNTRYQYFTIYDTGDALVKITTGNNGSQVNEVVIHTSNRELLTKYKKYVEAAITEVDVKENIQINFWYNTEHGPTSKSTTLEVPTWEEIADNYAPKIRAELESLVALNPLKNPTTTHGKLILFQGLPGSGKTFIIRALAKAWKSWCNLHYIIDVDQFFGSGGAGYMLKVLTSFDTIDEDDDYDYQGAVAGNPTALSNSDKYNLLILEDSGELISKTAHAETGQALSKLLNISDGLMGQGMKLFILITTNEELDALNDAVSRPGRCLASIPFDKLTKDEANAWLTTHNLPTVDGPRSLAELYSIRDKSNAVLGKKVEGKVMGFKR